MNQNWANLRWIERAYKRWPRRKQPKAKRWTRLPKLTPEDVADSRVRHLEIAHTLATTQSERQRIRTLIRRTGRASWVTAK